MQTDARYAAWYLTHYTGTEAQLDDFANHSGPMGLLVMSVAQLITHLTKTNVKRQRLRQGSQTEET